VDWIKPLKLINYQDLNAKQKENYNFQKASAKLADYGYNCLRLSDDWNGADFIALHIDGSHIKVQLKGRLSTDPKYINQSIFIMFEDKEDGQWYLYPHDELNTYNAKNHPDKTYTERGHSRGRLSKENKQWLEKFKV
jgi:hypothetical protein